VHYRVREMPYSLFFGMYTIEGYGIWSDFLGADPNPIPIHQLQEKGVMVSASTADHSWQAIGQVGLGWLRREGTPCPPVTDTSRTDRGGEQAEILHLSNIPNPFLENHTTIVMLSWRFL